MTLLLRAMSMTTIFWTRVEEFVIAFKERSSVPVPPAEAL
jgi:hypothetical protein